MAKSRKPVWWLIGSIVVVIGGLLIACARFGLLSASSRLDEELRLAKQQGLPLTLADLHLVSAPEDQNAAPLVVNAVQLMKTLPGTPERDLSYWGSTYWKPPISDVQAKKAIADLKPILDIALRASKRPHFDPHWNFSAGSYMNMPEVSDLKQLAKSFTARARFQIHLGHFSDATESLEAAARLSVLATDQPEVICLLTRELMEASVCAECATLLRRDASPESIGVVKRIVQTFGPLPDLRSAFRGTFLLTRTGVPQMGFLSDQGPTGGMDDTMYPATYQLMKFKPVEQLNEANFVKFYRMAYVSVPAHIESLNQAEASLNKIEEDVEALSPLDRIALDTAFLPSKQTLENWARCAARRRILAAGLDILEARAKAGVFPEKWSKNGEDGIDPFTAKSLGYRRVGKGFVVYSVDTDRVDDGGRPYVLDDGKNQKDISFEYPTLSVKPVKPVKPGPPGASAD